MGQIILLALIVGISLISRKEYIFYVLVILLPFHSFIKGALDHLAGGGELFSSWKEIIVLILIFKLIIGKRLSIKKKLVLWLIPLFFVVLFYFFINPSLSSALPALRNYVFPILLFIGASISIFDRKFYINLFYCFLVAAILSFFGCILQQFFFNIPISTLKGSIDFIDDNGYIQYSTESFRIMGFERMAGLFTGPNDLGVYCAIVILLIASAFLSKNKLITFSGKSRIFAVANLVMALFCILLSFSRTGWGIAIIGIITLLISNKTKIKSSYLLLTIMAFFVTVFVVIAVVPKASDIIANSFSGKEASAAARSGSFGRGITMDLSEPFGHGVGTTDNRYKFEFFVESAWLNTGYELGLMGVALLIALVSTSSRLIRQNNLTMKSNLFAHFAVAVTIASIFAGFVSINIFGTTYLYYWWMIIGLGLNESYRLFFDDVPTVALQEGASV